MCDTCEALICAPFNTLVSDYFRDHPHLAAEPEAYRSKFMPLDVRNAPKSATSTSAFKKLVAGATAIGYTPEEFLATLSSRSQFSEQVANWMEDRLPNGLARMVILTCAEKIIREAGAAPELTLLAA